MRILIASLLFVVACAAARADILADLTRLQPGRTMRHSSGLFDPESNADAYHLAPGQRLTIAGLAGPGEIRHMWFTVAGYRRWTRALVMRIYWDGSAVPSVETPIGDFFAAGNGMRAVVATTPIEVTSYGRALNSYWRMPFRRSARIEMENQSPNRLTVYAQIDWVKRPRLTPDTLYFHARYRQELPAKPFSPYLIFRGEGVGQYVGTVLSSQNSLGSWFGESDERFYIDGEDEPSIVGTGTEDFVTDAWNLRLFTNANAGVTIKEPNGVDCRMTLYRWHLSAPVVFRRSLKVEIERRSFVDIPDPETGKMTSYDFVYRPDFFSSVAFWYQRGVARPFCRLPPLAQRLNPETWVEVKRMPDRLACSPWLKPVVRSNRVCDDKTMLLVRNDRVGSWIEAPVRIQTEGQYSISVLQVLFRDYGEWKVTLSGPGGERVLDPRLDFHDWTTNLKENWPESLVFGTRHEAKLGVVRLTPGDYTMRFECVGANPLARVRATGEPGYSLGMDAISFRLLPWDRMDRWMADYLAEEKRLSAVREKQARSAVAALIERVRSFAGRTGRLPRSLRDVASGATALDPWGQRYRYEAPGRYNPASFDLYSVRGNSRDPSGWIGNWPSPYRIPGAIEGEDLRPARGTARTFVQSIATRSVPPTSAGKVLLMRFDHQGASAELPLGGAFAPGQYDVALCILKSWDYGIVQWWLDGRPLGGPIDGYAPDTVRRVVRLGTVTLGPGPHVLRAIVKGKSPSSTGYLAGLDAVVLSPVRLAGRQAALSR